MKLTGTLLLAGLASSSFFPAGLSGPQSQQEQERKPLEHPVTRFPLEESERLTREVQGAWTLIAYQEPLDDDFGDDLNGFALFRDGFLSLHFEAQAFKRQILGYGTQLFVQSGVYRYQFDQRAFLQTSSVMSFSNTNDDGELAREKSGQVTEYMVLLEDDTLQLIKPGVGTKLTYRRVEGGEFPQSALRKLERQRSGTPQWEEETDDR